LTPTAPAEGYIPAMPEDELLDDELLDDELLELEEELLDELLEDELLEEELLEEELPDELATWALPPQPARVNTKTNRAPANPRRFMQQPPFLCVRLRKMFKDFRRTAVFAFE
jgi:hypothetical protein